MLLPLLPGARPYLHQAVADENSRARIRHEAGDFIPVDRDGRIESAKQSVSLAVSVLAAGVNVTSFIEGTRSTDGKLLPFKKGPFYLAMESGAAVVPVTLRGTDRLMRKGSLKIYPGTARVTFHAPIDPKEYATREELMAAVRAAIQSGLDS